MRVTAYFPGLSDLGGEASTHTSMNGRSPRLDDDRDLIVVTVTEPVEASKLNKMSLMTAECRGPAR